MIEGAEPQPDPIETAPEVAGDLLWAREIVKRGESIILNNTWDAAHALATMKKLDYSSGSAMDAIVEAERQLTQAYEDDLVWTFNELERVIASYPGMLTNKAGQRVVSVELIQEGGRQTLHFLFEEVAQ